MIHITKTKTGFTVNAIGINGELISASEVLASKQNAWKNISALMVATNTYGMRVQDDTLPVAKPYYIEQDIHGQRKVTKTVQISKPIPKYIPGKNRNKK